VFRDEFTVVFEGSGADYILERFKGRIERIFRKVFPNGRLVINSKHIDELSRRECVDRIVSKDRTVTYLRARNLRRLRDRLVAHGLKRIGLEELKSLIRGELSKFYDLGLRGLSPYELKKMIRKYKTRKSYRGNLDALKSVLKRLNPRSKRLFRVHFCFYVSTKTLTDVLMAIPKGVKVILSCSPSIYERLSEFVRGFIIERSIGHHPRFWSRYMHAWVKHQIIGNGLRFSDVSSLIFHQYGYRVSAKRLAIRFWLLWRGKSPPL